MSHDGLQPRPQPALNAFLGALRAAPARLLLLDYDGTLAPLVVERERAHLYPGVREALAPLLGGQHTRVVLVSGRGAREVAALAKLEPAPEVWGCHGWERLSPDGGYALKPLPPLAEEGFARALAALAGDATILPSADSPAQNGDRVERKPAALAYHVRGLPEQQGAALLEQVRGRWQPVAVAHGLVLHPFECGLELRAPGVDKGTVVRRLLAEHPSGTACAYLGDDLTDEDAFRALAEPVDHVPTGSVRAAGVPITDAHTLGVLVRQEWRETAARAWLQPPQQVLDFLQRWRWACGGAA